jgi:hypothetical protein
MDTFVSRKRRRISEPKPEPDVEEESTDFKLALLASLHPELDGEVLLEALLASEGSVEHASETLSQSKFVSPKKRATASRIGHQSSLSTYRIAPPSTGSGPVKRPLTKKGRTLYLYSPDDIEAHTPCSIIYNFLPAEQANALLLELVEQSPTYNSLEFQLFDRVVRSPHTFCFYVNSLEEAEKQKTEYIYDGRKVEASQDLSSSPSSPTN